MPRCCNDNKAVSPVNTLTERKDNSDDFLLSSTRTFSTGIHSLDFDDDHHPIVEKSHRRLRCDLSPVPTNSTSSFNIKFLSIKVSINEPIY